MDTIDKLVQDMEKMGHEFSRDVAEKIILLSTIQAWKKGIPLNQGYDYLFDRAVKKNILIYSNHCIQDQSIIHAFDSKIKEELREYSREFQNYIRLKPNILNSFFIDSLLVISSNYSSEFSYPSK